MELSLDLLLTFALYFLAAFFFGKILPRVNRREEKAEDCLCSNVHDSMEAEKTFQEVSDPHLSASEEEETAAVEEQAESLLGTAEEDDWEGIEKSEVEKLFTEAAEFLNSARGNALLADLDEDRQTRLLGLHKIATEGPCYDSHSLTFKASTRAWQKLGRMNPDEAMEKYVALLSDSIPAWKTERRSNNGKRYS